MSRSSSSSPTPARCDDFGRPVRGLRGRIRCRPRPDRLPARRRRSGNADRRLPEARRGPEEHLPARKRAGWRDRRTLLDDRVRPGHHPQGREGPGQHQPQCRPDARRLHAGQRAAARRAARSGGREPGRGAARPALNCGRHLRLSRLRHGAPDGGAARPPRGSPGFPRGDPDAADRARRVRYAEGRALPHGARLYPPGHDGQAGLGKRAEPHRRRRRPHGAHPALHRHAARYRFHRGQVQHQRRAVCAHGRGRQGIHPRRRHLPGGAEPAVRGRFHAATDRALSCAAPHQPLALHVHAGFRRLRRGGVEPGNPGQGAGRQGEHPPHRRHPQARRHADPRQGTGGRAAERSQGAGRAPDAARSRPQRCRPGRQDR